MNATRRSTLRACARLDRNPVEKRLERRVIDLDVRRAIGRRRGEYKRPAIEPFVKHTCARAIEEKNLDRRAALPYEREESPAPHVVPHSLSNQSGETLEAVP